MFHELIYTRCRQGMDITRKGYQISSDGYKVYSCTPAIMEDGVVDLHLLANAAQTKQPYTDPGFMDDAYLFYTPDTGADFLINFYPIPFDTNAQGDYSHRPGNFVNHVLIGEFSQFYPYETFKDNNIWNAKTKGEAYYYETVVAALPPRNDISAPPGQYSFDEIGAFIADGRQEALAKSVSFLIAQYKEEMENRKYIVIKDESSRNIELWIAAIECAFSPRIASSIPFATRMDKFMNTNRYTVKLGVYQPQMNLQDPNQKQRYRAMIVGVDERDKTNANTVRPLANSPFVLLDGKQKQAMFESDISNCYYQVITKFDAVHRTFCREFLQAFNVLKPTADIYDLCEIFSALNGPSIPGVQTSANVLDRLSKYQAVNTGIFRGIYERIDREISRFMQEDLSYALNIINWLETTSVIVGDVGAKQRLTEIIVNVFTSLVFCKSDNSVKYSYWTQIQRTKFAKSIASVIADIRTIKDNSPSLKTFTPTDFVTFISIYVESVLLTNNTEQENMEFVARLAIDICYRNNDARFLYKIMLTLSQSQSFDSQKILFAYITCEDKGLSEFVSKYIINYDAAIIASDQAIQLFCKRLYDKGLEHLMASVLVKRVNILNRPSEMELFIKTIKDMTYIRKNVMTEIFELIDGRIHVSANDASSLAELLQTDKPCGAVCKNSAHIFALDIISGNHGKQGLINAFKDLTAQGFPTTTDSTYINKLIESSIKAKQRMEEQIFILEFLFRAPNGYFSAYVSKLLSVAAEYQDKWNVLFSYVSDKRNKLIFSVVVDIIVQVFVDSRQNKKSLAVLSSLLKDENSRKYFDDVADKVLEQQKSGIRKLLGKVFGVGDVKIKNDGKN